METALTTRSIEGTSTARRGLQFGLLTLLCFVAVVGLILGKWFYYRPLTVVVDARFAFVGNTGASVIMPKYELHLIENSRYCWLVLSDEELTEFLTSDGNSVEWTAKTAPHNVPFWPQTAFSGTYAESGVVRISPFARRAIHETGSIGGFLGSRIAGKERQFRVACDVSLDHTALGNHSPGGFRESSIKEKLYYEGAMPEGKLVFLAPIGNEYSVIIFDIKP